ncbi:MAG: hypothetical protein IKU67_01450 [Firmicutes bacterium]|nr:hypothetical protein [Bacillota bacterium]
MTLELLIAAVVAALPTIASIAGIIIATIVRIRKGDKTSKDLIDAFNKVKEEVAKTKEYENLKAQYESLQSQYYGLIKAHRELLTKIDHIARKEEDYEGKQTN